MILENKMKCENKKCDNWNNGYNFNCKMGFPWVNFIDCKDTVVNVDNNNKQEELYAKYN